MHLDASRARGETVTREERGEHEGVRTVTRELQMGALQLRAVLPEELADDAVVELNVHVTRGRFAEYVEQLGGATAFGQPRSSNFYLIAGDPDSIAVTLYGRHDDIDRVAADQAMAALQEEQHADPDN